MDRLRKIAEIPAGSWTKWLVVGFWLVVVVVAYPLQSKLSGVEKNDTSAWLPASAESVKVLDVQSRVQPPNAYTGVVVYYRGSGLTAADRAEAAADARRFAGLHGVVPGTVAGPVPSADGTAMQTLVSVNVGSQGWNGAIVPVDAMRAIAASGANGLASHVTGYLGTAADNAKEYKGLRRPGHHPVHVLDRAGLRGRVRHPARHHRGPVAARHRAQPGPRPVDVVAQQASPHPRPGTRRTQPGAFRRPGGRRNALEVSG